MTDKPVVEVEIDITLDEFEQLIKDSFFLECLLQTGVDNWEGYYDAYNLYLKHFLSEDVNVG